MNVRTKMNYRVLGRTGLKVSELGFGGHEYRRPLPTTLGKWGDINLNEFLKKQPQRNQLIEKGIDLGINYYDATQPEEAKSLGIALKELGVREEVYVALMILSPLQRLVGKPKRYWKRMIIEDVEEKLELLQSSYADILNVHMPEIGYSKERLTATIEALRELQEEGMIGWIGASSHKPRFLAELVRTFDCFDSVMVRYNYHLKETRDAIFPLCKVLEIGVIVMKPLTWPFYGLPFMKFASTNQEKDKLTPAQSSIKWILESEEVSTVVPGMNNARELVENFEAITRDEEPDIEELQKYLELATSPTARDKIQDMLKDQAIDIRFYAERVLKEFRQA
jgi:aryl-alcohol dehydrogenase-like predicted oxidoreductase